MRQYCLLFAPLLTQALNNAGDNTDSTFNNALMRDCLRRVDNGAGGGFPWEPASGETELTNNKAIELNGFQEVLELGSVWTVVILDSDTIRTCAFMRKGNSYLL